MPAAAKTDEGKPLPEVGQAFTRNRVAVLDDHARYKAAAARDGRGVTLDVVLETDYDLTPHPVPEERVADMTARAAEALIEERSSAGARPLDTAAMIPELEMGDLPAEADPEAAPEALAPPPPPLVHPGAGVDLAKLAEYLEGRLGTTLVHRINQIDGALAGLGFRLQVVSNQLDQLTGPNRPQTPAMTAPPAATPQVPSDPPVEPGGAPLSLSERRDLRRRGVPVPDPGIEAPASAASVLSGLGVSPSAEGPGSASRGRHWLAASMAAAACLVVGLAAWGLLASPRPNATALVEKQAQGLGAYVRAEERALRGYRSPTAEEFMQARALVLAASGPERDRAQANLTAMVREADAAARAQKALGTLYQVSGITPEP